MNGAAGASERSNSSTTSSGRQDALAPAGPRAAMDLQPPLTMRRCARRVGAKQYCTSKYGFVLLLNGQRLC